MIFLIFIFILPLILLDSTKADNSINAIQDKLLSNMGRQLEELIKQQEVQRTKMNSLKRLLREEGINFTHILEQNNETDNDALGFAIIRNMKSDFELLKEFHTQEKTFNIASEDKKEIKDSVSQSVREHCVALRHDKILQPTINEEPKSRLEYCTPNNPYYTFFPTKDTKLTFKLRASNDGHIALVQNPVDVNPIYEVVLGGWSNKRTVIRKDHTQEVASFSHSSILHDCEYIGFWVQWTDGLIQVGYDHDPKPLLSYNANDLYKVNYIGIHTGYGSTGSWIF